VAEPAPLRLGILGAARIAPAALLRPARDLPAATVVALAARDRTRAETFARRHDIPRVHTSYADLLADPEIDAVYNPLPNSLHCEWTVRALEAGKHVLCEKPIASNADEARHMAEAAEKTGRVLMEAFHYRYHPLAARMREIVASGELGRIRRIEAALCFPLLRRGDIRFDLSLAGGALMDAGCYAVNCVRFLADAEPEVVSARARLSSPGVDRRMDAELRFEGERLGKVTADAPAVPSTSSQDAPGLPQRTGRRRRHLHLPAARLHPGRPGGRALRDERRRRHRQHARHRCHLPRGRPGAAGPREPLTRNARSPRSSEGRGREGDARNAEARYQAGGSTVSVRRS
jgi:predicted dehydrogenase